MTTYAFQWLPQADQLLRLEAFCDQCDDLVAAAVTPLVVPGRRLGVVECPRHGELTLLVDLPRLPPGYGVVDRQIKKEPANR